MQQDKLPLSEVTTQLTKDCYSFTLPPLTPEQIKVNQAIVERVLSEVFGDKPDND